MLTTKLDLLADEFENAWFALNNAEAGQYGTARIRLTVARDALVLEIDAEVGRAQ